MLIEENVPGMDFKCNHLVDIYHFARKEKNFFFFLWIADLGGTTGAVKEFISM